MSRFRHFAMSCICASGFVCASPGETTLISSALDGSIGNSHSRDGDISRGGRYVGFSSAANNLIVGDTNTGLDAFVRDRLLGNNTRVSLFPNGDQASGLCYFNTMSRDGRYVCFSTQHKMLPEDLYYVHDIYFLDRQTGQLELISKSTAGVSGNGNSYAYEISDDGRYVAFNSSANNLAVGASNHPPAFAYRRDRQTGTTVLVSKLTNGQTMGNVQFVAMSSEGRYVAFQSENRPYVRDMQTGTTRMVAVNSDGQPSANTTHYLDLSANGRFASFSSIGSDLVEGDTNGQVDTFVHDLKTGATTRVTVASNGTQSDREASDGRISEDGRLIVFYSTATTLDSYGRAGGYGIFLHDRFTGQTSRISLKPDGTPVVGTCVDPIICPEGRFVTFRTDDSVVGTPNAFNQVYIRELAAPNQITGISLVRTVLAGANRTIGTVTMAQAGVGGPRVSLSESSLNVMIPASVQFADNSTTADFNVIVSQVATPEVVTITATFCDQIETVSLTLIPLAPSAFAFTPSPVVGGGSVSARLVMNGVAGPGGELVTLSDNSAFAVTPATAMVPPGAPQVTFTIATLPVSSHQYVTVTAQTMGGTRTGLLVISP